MTLAFIDEPSLYDTLQTWERHLATVRRLPADAALRNELIAAAEEMIERKQTRH